MCASIFFFFFFFQGKKSVEGGSDGLKKGDGAKGGGEGKPQERGEGASWFGNRGQEKKDGEGAGGGPEGPKRPPGFPELVSFFF